MSRFLEISRLQIEFRGRAGPVSALDGIDLAADEGDFICVVGPSGCGKTTLLKVIAGFVQPTAGSVTLAGKMINGPGPDRGVVFQQPTLYPWLTVLENVEFGLRMRGLPKRERREVAERFVKLVGLWDFRDKPPYELSAGMQQRVAIARALANDPRVLLMDEPFGALDALTREHLQEELLRIWKEMKKTVVLITHSVEEAVYLSTSVVVMSPRPGRIVAQIPSPFSRNGEGEGSSRAIKSTPEFVALREKVLGFIWDQEDT